MALQTSETLSQSIDFYFFVIFYLHKAFSIKPKVYSLLLEAHFLRRLDIFLLSSSYLFIYR